MSRIVIFGLAIAGIVACALVSKIDAEKFTYDGYSVIRSLPQTSEQLEHLRSLMPIAVDEDEAGLDFWTEPRAVNESVDVMVAPDQLAYYLDELSEWNISSHAMIPDLGEEIKMTKTGMDFNVVSRTFPLSNGTVRAQMSPKIYYSQYQRYSAIEAKLNELAELDERVKLEVIGKSHERRNLYLVKVSNDHAASKPVILLDAGHHAREWISHSTIMYLMESLVNIDLPRMSANDCKSQTCRQATSTRARLDLDKFDYWFMPVVNPDGYEYSHTSYRLWRKTRSPNVLCHGTDPNRNYPFHWRESGASTFACDQIYAGPNPMSEPEVRAVVNVMDNYKGRILMYLSLHSYSQLIMSPYGYARIRPHNYEEMEKAANKFVRALSTLRETKYKFGTTAGILYPAAGASDDYAHGPAGIRYSYTIELPDTGNRGFVLPASEIVPVGHEVLVGIQAMIESL